MAESKIVIVVGEHLKIESELIVADGHIRVVSRCGEHETTHPMTVLPGTAYTSEQMEYDLEVFRHEKAQELAGKVHVKGMLGSAISPTGNHVPEVVNGPRFKKPYRPPEEAESTDT